MRAWQLFAWSALVLVAAPLVVPVISALSVGPPGEWSRFAGLLGNTAALVALTLLIAGPAGFALALAVFGTNLPGRRVAAALLLLAVAVPLPVFAVAWQSTTISAWSPFGGGLPAAAWILGMAGLPWVALVVGVGLASMDPALRDEAMLAAPSLRLVRTVGPTIAGYLGMAVFWVAAQAAGEIVVTDVMQVRTAAEEVYTQFVSPTPGGGSSAEDAVGRAVWSSLPLTAALGLAAVPLMRRTSSRAWVGQPEPTVLFPMSSCRPLAVGLAGIVVLAYASIPVAALVRRAASWAAIGQAASENASLILWSLGWAVVAGFFVAAGVTAACFLGRNSRIAAGILLTLAVAAAVTPGPVVGVGLKTVIDGLIAAEERVGMTWIRTALYDGPSPAPLLWAWAVRGLPLAVAVLWPAVAALPAGFGDATRLETDSVAEFVRHSIWPTLGLPMWIAAGLVAVFALGEVSASRLVATPGGGSFSHDLFSRMHFGITQGLAADCLVLLAALAMMTTAWLAVRPRLHRPRHFELPPR